MDNCLTKEGATAFANTIASYWRQRGFNGIQTSIESFPLNWRIRREGDEPVGYRVVSNIGPNGYPPRA